MIEYSPIKLTLLQDIQQRKGWYIKRLLLFGFLSIIIFLFCTLLAVFKIISTAQVIFIASNAIIYMAVSLFSAPSGFYRKFLCWVGALVAYWIIYQLLAFIFIFLPSALDSETSLQMVFKTSGNTFSRIGYVDLVATLAGLFIQLKIQKHWGKNGNLP